MAMEIKWSRKKSDLKGRIQDLETEQEERNKKIAALEAGQQIYSKNPEYESVVMRTLNYDKPFTADLASVVQLILDHLELKLKKIPKQEEAFELEKINLSHVKIRKPPQKKKKGK